MLDKMASDLGIYRFAEEQMPQYKCRVAYSAIACWIKAIALDKPVSNWEHSLLGVSRRHIYDRSHTILETMVKMFPEIGEWFDLSEENEDSAILIRTRLIAHGDLLNEGFGTNLSLSSAHTDQITSHIETVYGAIIDDSLEYTGVSSIRRKEVDNFMGEAWQVKEWMQSFLEDVKWFHDVPNSSHLQYFNPFSSARNNYTAWQELMVKSVDSVILARTTLNKNSYEYYLLKPKEKLAHKLDSFLQGQGFQIRMMYALRARSNNRIIARAIRYMDHIKLRLSAVLPLRESTLLESYAWPVRKINDKLEWIMSNYIWDYINPYLRALDILIVEEEHG